MIKIKIEDEIDLGKISQSGQCFRAKKIGDFYRFITADKFIYIKNSGDNDFECSCTQKEWEEVWYEYFDLGKSYADIRKKYRGINQFTDNALDAGCGMRILKQEKFETLISFIISQRKSIPAISRSIEELCKKYGKKAEGENLYFFPSAASLSEPCTLDCSLGYRDIYVRSAAKDIAETKMSLDKIKNMSDDELLAELMKIKGVGVKVASCVALFAYSRGRIAPRDVWINRVIDEHFSGISPFDDFGTNAGIMQQYMFYYQRTLSSNPSSALSAD